ncbi:acylneuraminate cytidylyltransferase family protein [Bacillus sp. AK128]
MINNRKILAIVPARGGSKGILRKNLSIISDKPLLAWTIEEAKKSKYIDRLILSSEDSEIIQVAAKYGCEVPFTRPTELARDDTPGVSPILHAIMELPSYDYVMMLQPTSPLRTVEDIDGCIEYFINKEGESCVSVVEAHKPPHWIYKVTSDNRLRPILEGETVNRRQDAPKTYELNGAVYIASKEFLLEYETFLTDDTIAYEMPRERSYDIDTEMDLKIVKFLIENNI